MKIYDLLATILFVLGSFIALAVVVGSAIVSIVYILGTMP